MSHFDFKTLCSVALIGLQSACGYPQTASNVTSNTGITTNQPFSDSATNKVEEPEKQSDNFAHLEREHREILQTWLKKRPYLRPATEEADSILDENALADVHKNAKTQFYVIADFNKDRKEDFAVLLIDERGDDRFALAIFNGDLRTGQPPNYYEEKLRGISNCFLDYGGMDDTHLYLGVYEGDRYCISYIPKGNTYRFRDCM